MTLGRQARPGSAHLVQGMRLLLPGTDVADRLELSAGFLDAAQGPASGTYAPYSFVPRGPWRRPTGAEREVLGGEAAPDARPGDWIAVVPVPDAVLGACAELSAAALGGSASQLERLLGGLAGRIALVEAIRFATGLTDPARPGIEAPMLTYKVLTGSRTLTTSREHGKRIGLHVDSWYEDVLDARAGAANRISVNLGGHDRYLLCVNAPLRALREALPAHVGDRQLGPGFGLGTEFMTTFPDHPVTRIRVRPGEAYLAPTENMLHDGFAEPLGQLDLQFSARGYFRPPA